MGSKSVPQPAPIVVQGPTDADIRAEKAKEREDAIRGRKDAAAIKKKSSSSVASQSRRSGFSGSGLFIPGAQS